MPFHDMEEKLCLRQQSAGAAIAFDFDGVGGIALASLLITVITIRIRREDLAGTAESAQDGPAGSEPALIRTAANWIRWSANSRSRGPVSCARRPMKSSHTSASAGMSG